MTTLRETEQIAEIRKIRKVWIELHKHYNQIGDMDSATYYEGALRGIDHALNVLGIDNYELSRTDGAGFF